MAAQTLAGTVSVARVNLLPPEIAERSRVRRSQLAMVVTGLAALAAVGAMFVVQSARVSAAEKDLQAEQARTTSLTRQVTSLRNVSEVYARRDAAEQTLVTAMSKEIRWSRFLNDLSLTIPSNVWLSNLNIKQNLATAEAAERSAVAPGGATQALPDAGIGTVTFNGLAFEYDDIAAWLDALAKQTGYANAFMTNSARVDDKVETSPLKYESSVALTAKAYSNRFTKVPEA